MSVIKTGLGERLVSNDVEGKSFTELPVIDLSKLQSDNVEERRALAAEVRYTGCRLEGSIADYRAPAGPRGEANSLSLLIRRVPSAHSACCPPRSTPRARSYSTCQQAAIATGFFYISNHGVPQDVLDAAFDQAKTFFAQPMEKKMEVDHKLGDSFKGYVREFCARSA